MGFKDDLIGRLGWLANHWGWLGGKVNPYVINKLVGSCRTRPHPWSTAHPYVSWTSLTDQTYSARHLEPEPEERTEPPVDEVTKFFARPPGRDQLMCHKSTVLVPAFAQYLTDGFIRTRLPDKAKNETDDVRRRTTSNHQIDLCPLYGRNATQTEALRLMSSTPGERGRLKSQIIDGEEWAPFLYENGQKKTEFAALDDPPLFDPEKNPGQTSRLFAFGGDRANAVPHVAMMNTLFLREHNRLAAAIEADNPGWDDERVFETARNTVIVVFIKIVVEEYINHISGDVYKLKAIPKVAWRAAWNRPNWMTTEFSLLYRWHSLVPDTMRWGMKDYEIPDMQMNTEPLLNVGLAQAFVGLSRQPAGRLGPFNTAPAVVGAETGAITQGRRVRLQPYSAYRTYMGKSTPKRFEAISKNPEVVDFLRRTYKSPDDVEFYVGLFAEDPGKNGPLPPLMGAMVAVDAFSQAFTNPLLSEHVFTREEKTFSAPGWATITGKNTLEALVRRNTPGEKIDGPITMTRTDWKRKR
jgi:prostaglandin-endoperoxide synthase 2